MGFEEIKNDSAPWHRISPNPLPYAEYGRIARDPPTIGALPVTVLDGAHKFRSALITD